MRYLIVVVLVLFWNVNTIFSQDILVRSYGGIQNEESSDFVETTDGGYFLLGSTGSSNNSNSDIYLVKINEDLEFEWSLNYGNNNVNKGISIIKTEDDNYLILSNSIIENDYQIVIYKINISGEIIWQESYGGIDWDFGMTLISDPNDGFIIGGQTYNFNSQYGEAYIFNISSSGELLWENTYSDYHNCRELAIDELGNIFFIGDVFFDDNTRAGITKINSFDGEQIWSTSYGEIEALGLAITVLDSNIYISGKLIDTYDRLYAAKYSSDGDFIWDIVSTSDANQQLNSVTVNNSLQQVLLTGSTDSFGNGGDEVMIVRLNLSSGGFIDSINYGENLDDSGKKIFIDSSNKIMVLTNFENYNNQNKDIGIMQFANDTTIGGLPFLVENYLDETVEIDETLRTDIINISYLKESIELQFPTSYINGQVNIYNLIGELIYTKKIYDSTIRISKGITSSNSIVLIKILNGNNIIKAKVLID